MTPQSDTERLANIIVKAITKALAPRDARIEILIEQGMDLERRLARLEAAQKP